MWLKLSCHRTAQNWTTLGNKKSDLQENLPYPAGLKMPSNARCLAGNWKQQMNPG